MGGQIKRGKLSESVITSNIASCSFFSSLVMLSKRPESITCDTTIKLCSSSDITILFQKLFLVSQECENMLILGSKVWTLLVIKKITSGSSAHKLRRPVAEITMSMAEHLGNIGM